MRTSNKTKRCATIFVAVGLLVALGVWHASLRVGIPYSSLDPLVPVGESIGEGLLVHGEKDSHKRFRVVLDTLSKVGLQDFHARRYPHEFSGGQRQRIGIARALALSPEFIVADEPVSALDVSIRAQVVNLMQDLQKEFGLTYFFIAHDLAVVRHISNRIAIMYAGKIMEIAGRDAIYDSPIHPYTEALLSAVPVPSFSSRCLPTATNAPVC